MNEGWICPRCSKVNAPDVKACDCESDEELKKSNDDIKDILAWDEDLEKYFDNHRYISKWPEPIIPYYPDWTYRPYWPWPYYYGPIYTTCTGEAIGVGGGHIK
jgi:hypothetical protein